MTRTAVPFIVSAFLLVVKSEYYTDFWAVHIEGGPDVARDLAEKHGFIFVDKIMPNHYNFQHRKVSKRSINPSPEHHEQLASEPQVIWLEQQRSKRRVKRDLYSGLFNDPMWPRLWYMHREGGLDMNVGLVYTKLNITGRGVSVSILDDGIEKDHPDLMKNYDPGASYDVNDHDPDPQPRYEYSNENRHGTRCAGEVAAQANNGICSVGIAYDAGIGGVRMLDGDVTDAVEAQSISLNPQHIHIYSASWGPDDDGHTVDGPGPLARKAFFDGITQGRGGLGSIFVWASGNGGHNGDSCACDGYTNSIYTLSISSSSENGLVPWYSEACASTVATTYSSGAQREKQILTTDLRKQCTDSHTGTSASAPLAAGIIALVLEANPSLTWRDVQHIVIQTARQANLVADDWVVNGVGRKVSHHYGFGLMDAAAMVELALTWKTVPEQHRCEVASLGINRNVAAMETVELTLETDGCRGQMDEVNYLEHVQVVVTLQAQRRGEVELYLTSPAGTRATLLGRRASDVSSEGLNNWAIMTTHSWGEAPMGVWKFEIKNLGTTSTINGWSLVMYGTVISPNANPATVPPLTTHVAAHSTAEGIINSNESLGMLCQPGEFLLNGSCFHDCPTRYFAANQTNRTHGEVSLVCLLCHTSCSRCTGFEMHKCLVCESGRNLTNSGTCARYHKVWWSAIKISVLVMIACLLLLPIMVCVLVQARSWQAKRHLSKKYPNFIGHNRNDSHIPIEVSIDKPLLDVSSDSESEESARETADRH